MVEEAKEMNPLTGSLKFYASAAYNTVLALAFFLVVAHFRAPSFVGRVAIIQLLEVIGGSALTLLAPPVYTREIAAHKARKESDGVTVGTVLTSVLAATPALATLLFFPQYVWLSAPYIALYVYGNTLANIAGARGKFTQSALSAILFSTTRWGLSAIPAYLGSVKLLILVWTLGALAKVVYLHLGLRPLSYTFNPTLAKKVFLEGLPVYVSGILAFISGQGDRITTALLLGSRALGIYQLAALIASAPNLLVSVFTSVMLPSASYYAAKGYSVPKMAALTLRISLLVFGTTTAIAATAGPPIIAKLFPAYTEGIAAYKILVISTMVGAPYTQLYNFVVAARAKLKPILYISATTSLLVAFSSYLLIPRLGVTGAAISQASVQAVAATLFTVWATRQQALKIGKRELLVAATYIAVPAATYFQPLAAPLTLLPLLRLRTAINREELEAIEEFTPKKLRSIYSALKRLT